MADFRKSFMGACEVAGCEIAATSMSCGLEIKPGFYDHIYGKRDNTGSPKGPGGPTDKQKTLWRFLPGLAKLSASGLPLGSLGSLWQTAYNADDTSGGCIFSASGISKGLNQAKIASLTIDARAGENVSVSVELVAARLGSSSASIGAGCAKILTWADFQVDSGLGDAIAFSVTITNPIKPVYTSQGGYYADEIRCGIQEITGSVTTVGGEDWKEEGEISFNAKCGGGGGGSFKCLFEGSKYSGDSGGIWVATTNFYGHQ